MPITLTKRFAGFAFLVLLMLIPAVFINTVFGYLPALFLTFSGIVSAGYLLVLRRGISNGTSADLRSCHRGETAVFTIDLVNRSRLVLTRGKAVIFTEDGSGRDLTTMETLFSMGSEREQQLQFNVRFAHIGIYRAGIRQFELYDPLGIFVSRVESPDNAFSVSVLPKTVDIAQLTFHERNRVETIARPTLTIEGEGMDYSSVREYVTGDPMKQIHWKLSAHSNDYVTKVMEMQTNTGVSVVLDLTVPEYEAEEMLCVFDCIVESALSIAKYARRKGMDCDLVFLDRTGSLKRIIPQPDSTGDTLLHELGPMITDEDSQKAVALIEDMEKQAYGQTNMIVCTGYPGARLLQKIVQTRQGGRNPEVLIAIPPSAKKLEKESREHPFAAAVSQLEAAQINSRILTDVSDFL